MKKGGLIPKILIAIVVLGIIGAVFGGGKGDDSSSTSSKEPETKIEQTEATTDKATPEETTSGDNVVDEAETAEVPAAEAAHEEAQTIFRVGDTFHDGDVSIIYVASGEYISDNQYSQPADGNKFIYLKLAMVNESKSDKSISFYSFNCYADGYAADMYYGGDEELSATLSAGRSTEGYLYFEVPADAQEIEIEYEPNFFLSDKITFVYEGEQDSGYVLEGNTSRTDGALAVGDSVESSNVVITYLSCEDYTSDNMFVQPRDGYHYVTLTIEFENIGSSDEFVSSLSFDCFADGIACDQTLVRDDDISATISAGRKAQGTVTFEVPNDASVIEAEYLDNAWTSNRVVFTVV